MSYRTVILSSFEEYLACGGTPEAKAEEAWDREIRLATFPYAVMLQVSFPELDFANRWCWEHFGTCDGECTQTGADYRVCDRDEPHSHPGKWTCHWFEKTDYNFGFNEWYFAEQRDRDAFVAFVDKINWGERIERR
jgi:hypothetical protein